MGRLFRLLAFLILTAAFIALVLVILDAYFDTNVFPDDLEPDSWSGPDSWSEWRDIMIVFMGFFWALALLLLVILLAVLIVLAFTIRKVVRDHAAPALDSLKEALDNIRGTAEFTGETVASPIIRTYAIIAGVRRGLGAITHLPDRIRGRRKGKRK